jgi:hypothetical protein
MDPERSRELLDAERKRIGRALAGVAHQDDAEPVDDEDPGNLAFDLYQDELEEVFVATSRLGSAPWSVPRRVSQPAPTASPC